MSNGISKEAAREAMSPNPSELLEFFLIYYAWPADTTNFIALTPTANIGDNAQFKTQKRSHVIWEGVQYLSVGLESRGFNLRGDDELVRPRLSISNSSLELSKYIKTHNNLIGAKVIRKRTFANWFSISIKFSSNHKS